MKEPVCTIGKRFGFAASHRLAVLPGTHKCASLHGHNYEVEIHLRGPLTEREGWVLDYGELSAVFGQMIKQELDHRHLNDVLADDQPTAERLAAWLWRRCHACAEEARAAGAGADAQAWERIVGSLWRIRVCETPTTWAEVARGDDD